MIVNTALAAERQKPQGLYAEVYFSFTQSPTSSRLGGGREFRCQLSHVASKITQGIAIQWAHNEDRAEDLVGGFNG